MVDLARTCAWCSTRLDADARPAADRVESHGICPTCFEALSEAVRARDERDAPGEEPEEPAELPPASGLKRRLRIA